MKPTRIRPPVTIPTCPTCGDEFVLAAQALASIEIGTADGRNATVLACCPRGHGMLKPLALAAANEMLLRAREARDARLEAERKQRVKVRQPSLYS